MNGNNRSLRRFTVEMLARIFFLFLVFVFSPAWGQEQVRVRAWDHDNYGRIVFDWPSQVAYAAQLEDNQLVMTFDQKMAAVLDPLNRELPTYIEDARLTPDKQQVVITLTRDFDYQTFVHDRSIVVDLSEKRRLDVAQSPPSQTDQVPNGAETPTAKPAPDIIPDKRPLLRPKNIEKTADKEQIPRPVITIRTGEHAGFGRVVFDWNRDVPYKITTTDDKTRIRFQSPATFNLAKVKAIPQLGKIESQTDDKTSQVTLDTPPKARLRHFRTNGKVVVDILNPASGIAVAQKATGDKATPSSNLAVSKKSLDQPGSSTTESSKTAENGEENAVTQQQIDESRTPLTLEASYNKENDRLVLRFKTPADTLAIAYQRAGYIWVGFDRSFSPTLNVVEELNNPFLKEILLAPIPGLTLLRLDTPNTVSPLILRDKSEWLVELAQQPLSPQEPITPESIIGRPGQPASVFLPEDGEKRVVRISDPEVGDEIILIPTGAIGRGIQGNRDYIQFVLPRTAQGVVVIPHADSVQVTKDKNGIFVGDPDGLYISSRQDLETGGVSANSLLDISNWRKSIKGSLSQNRKRLLREIIETPEEERNQIRLRLAQYYLAYRMYGEARGLLQYMAEIDSTLLEDPSYMFLTGVTHYLDGAYTEAAQYLNSDTLLNHSEAVLWRAALAAQNIDWETATEGFDEYAYAINVYDDDIAEALSITAAEAALKANQVESAKNYIDNILKQPESLNQRDYVRYLQGKILMVSGEESKAADIWQRLTKSKDRKASAFARTALIDYQLKQGEISLDEAIEDYENLAFTWRGDHAELERSRRLAELYQQRGDLRQSLLILKGLAINFLDHPDIPDITIQMSDIFSDIFLGDNAEELDPIAALSIFQEFRELTPVGEKGDRLIEQLIDRMVMVDLLDSASELLEQQIVFRTKGVEKAQSGLKLAMIDMLNQEPEKALNALDISTVSGIPEDLATERRHVRARALYEAGQKVGAIELLQNDDSMAAEDIRAELYWRSQEWAQAAEAIGRMTTYIQEENLGAIGRELFGGQIPSGVASLPENTISTEGIDPQVVLRWAVALALSNNKAGLDFLRQNYDALMRPTPFYTDFSLITQEPISSSKTMEAIAKQINQVDQYTGFLDNYRERLNAAPPIAEPTAADG